MAKKPNKKLAVKPEWELISVEVPAHFAHRLGIKPLITTDPKKEGK